MADEPLSARRDLTALRLNRDEHPPRSRAGWIASALALVAIVAGLAWKRWSRPSAPPVETGLVRLLGAGEGGAVLSASGYILPDRKADVSSKLYGRLEWLGIDVGSKVKKDQVIAKLANADVAAQLEEAKVGLREAEREYERWKKIVESGTEPAERLDKFATALELARAREKKAAAWVDDTQIRAPFDGVVVRRFAQLGETVGPPVPTGSGSSSGGGALCTLMDPASLEMIADVNETNIAKLREGQGAEVHTEARPDRKYKGQIRLIVPTADRQKGIVQAKIRLLDPDDKLLPEMAARAAFLREGASAGGPRKVMAPRGAIRERGGRKIVFVVENGKVRAAPVETGAEGDDGVEIRSGLLGGERVVTGGAAVEDGQAVRLEEKR